MASRDIRSVLRVKADRVGELHDMLADLVKEEVLVGVPDTTTDDRDDGTPITNAALAYIHDRGAPEANIPARPFMIPGMTDAEGPVADSLAQTARDVFAGRDKTQVNKGLHKAGMIASTSIKRKLNEGIPPPLAEATLRDRLRRAKGRKGEKTELARRAAGEAPSTQFAKPLVDTGALRNSINYVIRPRKARST